jgi:dTDP-glucose pyrophosphorylase
MRPLEIPETEIHSIYQWYVSRNYAAYQIESELAAWYAVQTDGQSLTNNITTQTGSAASSRDDRSSGSVRRVGSRKIVEE